jgi:hypothetical protein
MSSFLKDSIISSSSPRRYYIWNEKRELTLTKSNLTNLKERMSQDSLIMWDSLKPIETKSKKINKCKLDIGHTYKYTNSDKVWAKMYFGGNVRLVLFSEILYYKEEQALCYVQLKCCAYDVTQTYYFFFEKENEKWKIRRVADFYRV